MKFVSSYAGVLVTDEVEVYRGPQSLLASAYSGTPITSANQAAFFNVDTQRTLLDLRIVRDAQDLQRQVQQSTQLTADQKTYFLSKLDNCILDAMYDNPPNNVVLPIDPIHANVFKVQAELWRAEGLSALSAWTSDSSWDLLKPTQSPTVGSANVDVTLMQNEFRSGTFNISNPTDSDLTVNLSLDGLPGGTNPSWVTAQEVAWIDTTTGIPTASPLIDATYDSVSNSYLIHVPAGMTRQVWLTFHPMGVTPGTYDGTATINGGSAGTVSVPLHVYLSPLTFPSQPTLSVGGWDYTDAASASYWNEVTPTAKNVFIANLREHFVNTAWATSGVMSMVANPTDFSKFDQWAARWQTPAAQPGQQYYIFLNAGTTFAGFAMGTDGFNSAVRSWIRAMPRIGAR